MLINTPEPTPYKLQQIWWSYLLANWLYYHAPGDHESPMTDAEWDSAVEFLNKWNHLLPEKIQQPDHKTAAFGIKHTRQEIDAALRWENLGGRDVPEFLLPDDTRTFRIPPDLLDD